MSHDILSLSVCVCLCVCVCVCVCVSSSVFIQVVQYTAGHINYGGSVTDDRDRCCLMNILNDFHSDKVLAGHYIFSPSGTYHQLDPDTTRHKVRNIITHKYLVTAILFLEFRSICYTF